MHGTRRDLPHHSNWRIPSGNALVDNRLGCRCKSENVGNNCVKFTIAGCTATNPRNQNAATVDFRIFAQAKKAADLALEYFATLQPDLIMLTYPGATSGTGCEASCLRTR